MRGIEWIYPVHRIFTLAAELNRRTTDDGLAAASRWLLDTWVPGWQLRLPPQTTEILSSYSVVIYGNHPSLLTPFLVAASAERPDLKIISDASLEKLLPGYAHYSLPVALPLDRWWDQFRRGGLPRVTLILLLSRVVSAAPCEKAKETNRRAVADATEHVRSGKALLVAPGGWGRRSRPWHLGIGRIVKDLSSCSGDARPFLISFHEENSSDGRIRALLGTGPWASLKRRFVYRRPVTIRFGRPTALSKLACLPEGIPDLVRILEQRYHAEFPRRP